MPLITAAEFLDRFDVDSAIDEKRIKPHIGAASRRLRGWVGAGAYDDAAAGTPSDADRAEDLKNAEAHLAYHFAVRGLHFTLSGKGIVATSMSSEGKEMRKYLTPDETEKVATQMLELAREIAEPYLIATDDASIVVTEDDADTGEATTRSSSYGSRYCC